MSESSRQTNEEHHQNNDDTVEQMTALNKELEANGGDRKASPFETAAEATVSRETVYYARRLLYVSHFFAQFSEIAWQFCLALFLAAYTNYQSLILVSTYGLCVGLAVCLGAARAGRYIDESNRLSAARRFIWAENLSVVTATIFCYMLLSRSRQDDMAEDPIDDTSEESWLQRRFEGVPLDVFSVLLLVGIHAMGAFAQIMDQAFLVAIERDWVVVISRTAAGSLCTDEQGNESLFSLWLSETNVAMKQIDLSCKVAAPTFAGLIIPWISGGQGLNPSGIELRSACLFIGVLNMAALVVEYLCTARIYEMIPALAVKDIAEDENDEEEGASLPNAKENVDGSIGSGCGICRMPLGLRVYFREPISWGGLGLAMLYLNALTFGNGIMTTYLLYRGMKLEGVGVLRGVASAIGLLGTFVYHFSSKRLSVEATGMWSITYEFCCLSVSYASLYIDAQAIALSMLVAGVCLSRIGLWVFDISITQMQQQEIPDDCRGIVGGVQQALNAFFNLMSFGLGILFPNPKDFHIYVSAGVLSVGIAALLFAFGVYHPRYSSLPQSA